MVLSIAVVCEGPTDRRTGCELADRVVCEAVDWLEEDTLEYQRAWRGLKPSDPSDECLLWKRVKRLARPGLIPMQGFGGEPAKPDAHAARKFLWLLHASDHPPDAVVFLRDDDGDENHRKGLEQARRHSKFDTPIVIGVAHTKRECWVLAGFDPQTGQEEKRLDELKKELGFDPCRQAERLNGKKETPERNAKRVLKALTGGDPNREAECWQTTDLETLQTRGKGCGLADYLEEVRDRLTPLFGGRPGRS